jgi:hypothetical protein
LTPSRPDHRSSGAPERGSRVTRLECAISLSCVRKSVKIVPKIGYPITHLRPHTAPPLKDETGLSKVIPNSSHLGPQAYTIFSNFFYTAREPDLSPYWVGSSDWESWSDGGGEILESTPIEEPHSSIPLPDGQLSFPPLYFPNGRRVSFDSWEAGEQWVQDWVKHGAGLSRDQLANFTGGKELAFKLQYRSIQPEVVNYLETNWMWYKKKWACAWTNKYIYFGHTASSRGESSHHAIKADLLSRPHNLSDVISIISLYLKRRNDEVKHQRGLDRGRRSHLKHWVYNKLHFVINSYAMERVQLHCKQFNMDIKTELPPCTGVFTTTMGLPCVHKVQGRMRANQTLEANDSHLQWRFNRLEKLPPSFLNDDPVTATSPLPDILLRDPQEDPVPPISEDLL